MAKERILVVDDDPDVVDLVAQQILIPQGFQVATAMDGNTALQIAIKMQPDVLFTSLFMPGLSGRDLLTALRSQNVHSAIIVTVPKSEEAKALQAFRLGAKDYLTKPLREAEVMVTIDRALEEVRMRRDREQMAHRVQGMNEQLERRVKELTTLYGIGKAVTALTNPAQLFGRLMEGALFVTEAELGWLLLAEENSPQLILRASKNMPILGTAIKVNQPWDDGLSAMIVQSGEGLILQGAPLTTMRAGQMAKAIVAAPVKSKEEVLGVLVVGNKTGKPFTERDQAMLSAVADYAAVGLVNARLFQSIEAKARSVQQAYDEVSKSGRQKDDLLGVVGRELRPPFTQARTAFEGLMRGDSGPLAPAQAGAMRAGLERLELAQRLVDDMALLGEGGAPRSATLRPANLSELAKQAIARLSMEARQNGVGFTPDLTTEPHTLSADVPMLTRVFDNLLLYALKVSPQGSTITVRVRSGPENSMQVTVIDQGPGFPADKLQRVWERFLPIEGVGVRKNLNTGLALVVAKQIIEQHNGRIWVDSDPGKGSAVSFALRKL